jgi:hypothetical protein
LGESSHGEGDFKVIGTLIQLHSFMDFNLRRALEIFHGAKMIPKKYQKLYPNLPDAMLTEALGEIIKSMDPEIENVELAQIWIEVINTARANRNLAGHFAAKRFPNHDVYVFVSKSNRDAKRFFGFDLADRQVHFSIVGRTEFAEAAQADKSALDWLVPKIPEWHKRYSGESFQSAATKKA